MSAAPVQRVQTYGKKKLAIATVTCQKGRGVLKVNGVPLNLVQPEGLRLKLTEPINLLPRRIFGALDLRVRVSGGGQTSQIFAARQAIGKAVIAYFQKYRTEKEKADLKKRLLDFDRSILVADPRRTEPKKFGGHGARSRFTKSYR